MGQWLPPKDITNKMKKKVFCFKIETEIEYEEEFKMPEFAELGNVENWSHLNPNIL